MHQLLAARVSILEVNLGGTVQAWSELKICLVYVGDLLRLRVLDTELLDVYVVDEAAPKNR